MLNHLRLAASILAHQKEAPELVLQARKAVPSDITVCPVCHTDLLDHLDKIEIKTLEGASY